MAARQALSFLLRVFPDEWKCRLGIHLGAPHVRWSLRQLRSFGFIPANVLDVGAFTGEWARACIDTFPEARITCIEPQDAPQAVLRQLAGGHGKLDVIQTLLGRRAAERIPFADRGSGSSVLLPANDVAAHKPMTTIDQLVAAGRCLPPQLVKLDVQGFEIDVLDGWTTSFDACEVIQCEISLLPLVPGGPLLAEVVAYLARRGFVMFDVTELIRSPFDGAVWQIDALFCRADSPLRALRAWRGPSRSAAALPQRYSVRRLSHSGILRTTHSQEGT